MVVDLRPPERVPVRPPAPAPDPCPWPRCGSAQRRFPFTGRVVLYASTPRRRRPPTRDFARRGTGTSWCSRAVSPPGSASGFPSRRADDAVAPRRDASCGPPGARWRWPALAVVLLWTRLAGRSEPRAPGSWNSVLVDNDTVRVALLAIPARLGIGRARGAGSRARDRPRGELTLLTAGGREVLGPDRCAGFRPWCPTTRATRARAPQSSGSSW